MADQTEAVRREMVETINSNPQDRELLSKEYGQVWDTQELGNDFEVKSFAAPFVLVKRKSDGQKGTLMFQHYPRFYFSFEKAE